jgi:hypothetical protein
LGTALQICVLGENERSEITKANCQWLIANCFSDTLLLCGFCQAGGRKNIRGPTTGLLAVLGLQFLWLIASCQLLAAFPAGAAPGFYFYSTNKERKQAFSATIVFQFDEEISRLSS